MLSNEDNGLLTRIGPGTPMGTAKALQDEGVTPPGVEQPEVYAVRSAIVNLPKEVNWVEASRDMVKAFPGLPAVNLA